MKTRIEKGAACVSLCCGRRYRANFTFEATNPLVTDRAAYLRGKCFLCVLRTEIAPALKRLGIEVSS